MIKKLVIENFQSHEKTELNLDPGVNVITGVSQSGKTAILRALYWLFHNRPSGERIRSHFAKGATKVMIETSEGDSIWHVKDDKYNSYAIGDNLFDKIGKDVPDMVQRALRISELNVQKQLDEPFLVTSSAGEVAKTINRITRLEMVDNWVSDLTSKINSINREKERLEAEIEASKNKIKSYRVLVPLQPILDRAKEIDERLDKLNELKSKITYLTSDIDDKSAAFIKFETLRSSLSGILDAAEKINTEIEKLSERAKVARSAIKAHRTLLKQKGALELIEKVVALEESKVSLSQKSKIITEAQTKLDYFQKADQLRKHSKAQLLDALKQTKTCPTCLQPIDDKAIKKLVGEI
jgi:exonuclease SbcC